MAGRHRNTHRIGVKLLVGFVVLVVAAGLGWGGYRFVNRASCGSHITLRVAAAPEIAPVVRSTASAWSEHQDSGTCVTVTVTGAEPADVAAAIAHQAGATVSGVGQTDGKTQVPDVWIPDSSTWLERIRAVNADIVPAVAQSVASSPVVLAVPQPLAKQALGWPAAKLTWPALLQKMTGGQALKAGIVDPDRDASGLSGLMALSSAVAAAGGASAQQSTVAALRALAANRSTVRADLVGRFPRAGDATTLAAGLAAAPLSEQAVIAYNAAQPPVPLAPVFLNPAPTALDYPYAVLPSATNQAVSAANELLGQLTGAPYRNLLAQHGLRAPDGTTGAGFPTEQGAPPPASAPAANLDPAVINQVLNTWGAITQAGRILAVLDVSGSMKTAVPTAGGKTREQVTVQAADGGLSLFGDDWDAGLWTFSTKLDGDKPYRQLVPIGPVSSQRSKLDTALNKVTPTSGDTGLYDTILAAYKAVQTNWDPKKVNSIVLMTDGQNDNPGGLTLNQLLTQLRSIVDPQRKVEVIAIGIGEASQSELSQITAVTSGQVFIASDPSKINEIFLQAIALRPGSGS
ncbi:substrate-binding and VWA domain-containing protein [Rugosimonospora acidiphila]|uniref:Substrate-binding and VWA domain-containing protein n=1 Tax=Rugosimonospora acidiphila TaxID=556531 RepID=A0ABP9S8X0_9ACTN